jgi:hypothetical protein
MKTMLQQVKSVMRPGARAMAQRSRGWRRALRRWRHVLTAPLRVLPDFVVIGAQKGGTSTLRDLLRQHPGLDFSLDSEPHFFDNDFHRGPNWYRAQFPSVFHQARRRRALGYDPVVGEKSPYYLFYPLAPRRVFSLLPQAKLIVMLRNPVDRAYSHYFHEVRQKMEPLTFEQALDAEPERLAGELDRMLRDERYISHTHVTFSYLARGVYADQIQAWQACFGHDQILVLSSDELFSAPDAAYRRVLSFLNLPYTPLKQLRRSNTGRYPKMEPATRARLVDYFRPHNQRLYDLLGTNFDWDR